VRTAPTTTEEGHMHELAGPGRGQHPPASRERRPPPRLARLAAACAAGALLVVAGAAAAGAAPATLYVNRSSPSCSNSGPGSAAVPYCSIARAATVAAAGQTVLVAAGTYNETVTVARSGSPGAPITFRANGAVTVRGGANGYDDPGALEQ
jgi:hypothetical protein